MDRYPDDYVFHNLPLIIVSGLDASDETVLDPSGKAHNFLLDGGFRIKTESPTVKGDLAKQLLHAFRNQDASKLPWHSQALAARNGKVFRISYTGRVYTLPPRKAPPPPHSPRLSAANDNRSPPPLLVLHSPLSPLTPTSPLYPDGIISSLWLMKHQTRLPSAFIVFFYLTSNSNTSSLEDNRLKSEISNIRSALSATTYKTKVAAVLVGDGTIPISEVEERISAIRRSCGLDGKSIHFLPHGTSTIEVVEFTKNLLLSLHPVCIEYYRELSKHVRRKRNRNVVPQPTVRPGGSHVLALPGWSVRYEFKLGVLAEFRQEMDAACRNYEAAYEGLFSAEVIDSVAVWSPRFNEARLLADIIAFRTIRCLLYNDQIAIAVRSWLAHRERIKNLVDRRRNGTENYGWEAWQSAWAQVMADLISGSHLPGLYSESGDNNAIQPVFVGLERSLPLGERVTPWEQLHHEGYWLDLARKATIARRRYALEIPDDDRQPPGRSPASLVSSKAGLYDTYLALEPYQEIPLENKQGYDYGKEIVTTLDSAIDHFSKRGQLRKADILRLEKAIEHVQSQFWKEAISTLQPLWKKKVWREAGWWSLLQRLAWTILDCLMSTVNVELSLQLLWELSCDTFESRPGSEDGLRRALITAADEKHPISVAIDIEGSLSPLVPTFAFSTHNVFVGEPLDCQLTIRNRSREGLSALQLSSIKVAFEGHCRTINIIARDAVDPSEVALIRSFVPVTPEHSSNTPVLGRNGASTGAVAADTWYADLNFPASTTRVFKLQIVPREAGEISVASITLLLGRGSLVLSATASNFDHSAALWWETKSGLPIPRVLGPESIASNIIIVQPKLPKLRIHALDLRQAYYVNEALTITFEVLNEEAETATIVVEGRMISPVTDAAVISWAGSTLATDNKADESGVILVPRDLGTIQSGATKTVSVQLTGTTFAVDYEVELTVHYVLESDADITLTTTLGIDVPVTRPFEANYDFLPRLSDEPWPHFFEPPPTDADFSTALGLKHRYVVKASLYSFANEPVVIEAILLTANNIIGGAVCSSHTGIVQSKVKTILDGDRADAISTILHPEQTEKFDFELLIQKIILGDRHTVGIDLSLEIGWRRQDSDQVNSTILEVPRLVAAVAEPRVVLRSVPADLGSARPHKLEYMVENPSMHFLTFSLTMEASEHFSFSGPKTATFSLVPMSRDAVVYSILPKTQDEWIMVNMTVVDAYFGQTLKVVPGDDGVRVDKTSSVFVKV